MKVSVCEQVIQTHEQRDYARGYAAVSSMQNVLFTVFGFFFF